MACYQQHCVLFNPNNHDNSKPAPNARASINKTQTRTMRTETHSQTQIYHIPSSYWYQFLLSSPISHITVLIQAEAVATFSIAALSAGGFAPTTSPTFSPFLKIMKVGMARTPTSWATSGTSSTSTLMKWAEGYCSENLGGC